MEDGEVVRITASAQTAYNRTMLEASDNAKNLAARYEGLAVDIDAIPEVSKAATLGLKALSVAGNMLLSVGISMAISFVISKVMDLAQAQENAIAKADEAISKINEEREALTKTKTTIDSISGDYEKLAKGVDNLGRNISLSSDEYSRYNEFVNQIAEMFPQMVQGYTDEGNAIISCKGNVEELTRAYEEQKKAAQDAIITGSADVFKGFKAAMGASWSDSSIIEQRNLLNEIVATQGDIDKIAKITNRLSGTASQSVLEDLFEKLGLEKGFLGLNLVDNDYISENITKFQSLVSTINSQIETEATKIKPIMQAYLDNSFELNKVDSKTADIVKQVVSQFGAEFYSQFENETEMATWIDENIVKKLQNKDVQAKFETALELQTKFNNNEIPVKDYQEKVNALLDAIKALPPETQKAIKLLFGIETDENGNSTSDVDTMIANVKKKFDGKFEKEIGELTLGELEILSNMDISPDGIESWDEVKKILAESAKAADKATSSLSDFEKVSDNIGKLSTAYKELSDDGYITIKTINELKTATGLSGDEWAAYETKLLNAKAGSAEFNQIMSDLTYKMIENQVKIGDLTNATDEEVAAIENKIAATLRENGVTNASAVAHDAVVRASEQAAAAKATEATAAYANAIANGEDANAAYENAQALLTECGSVEVASSAMEHLNIIQCIFNNTNLDASQKITELQKYGFQASLTAAQLSALADTTLTYSDGKWWVNYYEDDKDNNGEKDYLYSEEYKGFEYKMPEITPPKFSGSSSSSSKNAEDEAKKAEEEAKKAEEERIQKELDALKAGLEMRQKLLDKYKEAVDLSDFGLELAEESDFTLRVDLLNSKMSQLTSYGQAMREEFDRVASIIPETADQADALASHLESLGSDMRSNITALRETQLAMEQLKIDTLTAVGDNHLGELERELDSIERRIELLNKDNSNDYEYTNQILNMEMFLPTGSSFSQAKSNRSNEDKVR